MLDAQDWAFLTFHLRRDEEEQQRRERIERDDLLSMHLLILYDPRRASAILAEPSEQEQDADPEEAFWASDPYFGALAMEPPPPTPISVLRDFGMTTDTDTEGGDDGPNAVAGRRV